MNNERLIVLSNECTSYKEGLIEGKHDIEVFDKEKFAELIVAECIEQIITGPNGPAHYAMEAALRVKKHFGVEQ
jgi:hypothetical protein